MKVLFASAVLSIRSILIRCVFLAVLAALLAGCHSVQPAAAPIGPHFRVLAYNINWGMPRADLAAEVIRKSGAEIVCLQQTTPQWEMQFRPALSREYPNMEFRESHG